MTVHKDRPYVKIEQIPTFRSSPLAMPRLSRGGLPTGFGSCGDESSYSTGASPRRDGVTSSSERRRASGDDRSRCTDRARVTRRGARNVIAIDPVDFKRDQAVKFGATHVYPSMAEAIAPIIDLTHGVMAEKTIITVGEMRGEYIEEAMTLTAKTGTCVVTGMGAMTDVDVKLNLFLFTMLQKTLKGNIFGGGSSHVDTPKLVGLYKSGLLKIDEMVTNTYALEDINDGYQDMLDGKNIRGVIKFTESDW